MDIQRVERRESREVRLTDPNGEAIFRSGVLTHLYLHGELGKEAIHLRAAVPMPLKIEDTADRLTSYIEFLRFVRAEVRRINDGAQEADDDVVND